MNLVTIIWSMSASASLTLAAINFMVWFRNRKAWANLLFTLLAMATAAWTVCEMRMMHAATPAELAHVLKWGHVAIWLLIVSLVGFVRLYLQAGRRWLAWTVLGTRTVLLVPNFLVGQNLNFLEITRLSHMRLLGESVAFPEGIPNPWIILGEINLILLIIFVVDAAVMTWRRGERHRAITVGGSIVFFVLVSAGQSLLMHWKIIILPYIGSIFFMGLVLVMGYDLGADTIRASELSRELQESEKRFRLMADTAPSLIWMCDDQAKVTYLNEQRRVFTGEDSEAGFGDSWKEYVHPDDLHSVEQAIAQGLKTRQSFSHEYRLRRQDGTYRWMLDVASPRLHGDHSVAGLIGSAVDVTDQKLAEDALRRVGGKLIEVQEQERSRIARELHDDICQRLILLSMEIEQVNRRSEESSEKESLIEVQRHCSVLAGDVQLLSHQLHSSKLEYLGLSTALRSFIREFSQQHHLTVAFTAENVPKILPADISLCFFRIGQEALQNARKYSGASEVSVQLEGTEHELCMEVSDEGVGFDKDVAKKRGGLGLVSMGERVNLVNGTLSINTELNKGTSIVVRVPLPETLSGEPEGQRAQIEGKERDHEARTHFAGR